MSHLKSLKEDESVQYYVYVGADPEYDAFDLLASGEEAMEYIQSHELTERVMHYDGMTEQGKIVTGQVGFLSVDVPENHLDEIRELSSKS